MTRVTRWMEASLLALAGLWALGASPGCRPSPASAPTPDPDQVVATWVGGSVKRSDIETAYARRLATEPGAPPERQAEMLRLALERRVRIELLYREAQAAGLPERPDLKVALRAQAERLLAEDWLEKHVARAASAAPAQVEAEVVRRSAHPAQETRRFSHIFLRAAAGDAAARHQARQTMAALQRELAGGAAFEDLARRHSDSITARAGGQVEWTARGPLQPTAAATVFAMVEGQVSDVVETEAGLHLFRLDGIRRPTPVDAAALRADVRQALDAEAGRAAVVAERQRVWDDSGVSLDERALARPQRPEEVVATVGGEALTRAELDHARGTWASWAGQSQAPAPAEAARTLIVNRLIAPKRSAEPIERELQKRLDDARRNVVVEARRLELIGTIPTEVTAEEIAAFYEQQRESAPFLRDHVVDLLFFPQKSASPAEVYAQGEQVTRQLREGRDFDQVLAARAGRALVERRLPAGDLDSLRQQSNRLYKTVSRLAVGEVSSPVYMDGEQVPFQRAKPVIGGKGLAFVRLVEVRPLPLAATRDRIEAMLRRQKEAAGVAQFQKSLNERAQLKILVDRL